MQEALPEKLPTILRFGIVGGLSALSYSLLQAAITGLTVAPVFASGMILFCLFIPVTFAAHKRVTFRARTLHWQAFRGYALLQLGCFAMVSFVTTRMVTGTYLTDTILYIATVGLAAVISFLVGRFVLFRHSPAAER